MHTNLHNLRFDKISLIEVVKKGCISGHNDVGDVVSQALLLVFLTRIIKFYLWL